ncbi:unnamed protein product [Anisakis simplex]|uniref:Major facilitator superfamily (MFS) profile domain-containing protein n=1 Tax=Anisakis simplex TaxID=6269 RepID=A0A3P6Q5Z0_ANISI|nr:unnamed protein product [Anisakis simplex]
MGKYQITLFFIICLPASLPSAFSAFNQPFVVGQPEHHCKLPNGRQDLAPIKDIATQEDLNCHQYNQTEVDFLKGLNETDFELSKRKLQLIPCQLGWEYDNGTYLDSLVTEFDLVCNNKGWVDTTSTAFYIGGFVGNILFGYIADKYDYAKLKGMEFMDNSGRIFSGIMIDVFFGIGMTLLGVLAMLIRRWRLLTFFSNAPFVLLFSYYLKVFMNIVIMGISHAHFLPESPRWLISAGKFSKAKKIIERIAKVNGKKDVDMNELMIQLIKSLSKTYYSKVVHENIVQAYHELLLLMLFFSAPTESKKFSNRHKSTSLRSLQNNKFTQNNTIGYIYLLAVKVICDFRFLSIHIDFQLRFVNAVVYNGLTFNISNLPVSDYVSFIVNGAVEIPAYLLAWPSLGYLGRRWTLALLMLLGGFACVSTMFAPASAEHPWIISGLAYVGKFGIAGSFAVIYIFAGELYPTVLRAMGMGMSSMVAGFGLILGPYLVRLGDSSQILPLLIMGLMSVSAGLAAFFLPETLGIALPQTLEEAETLGNTTTLTCMPGARRSKRINQWRETREKISGDKHSSHKNCSDSKDLVDDADLNEAISLC